MIIFISPAKTFRQSLKEHQTKPIFLSCALKINKALKSFKKTELMDKMKISQKVADQTFQYIHNFNQNVMPAIDSYYGHQYKHLNIDSFSPEDLNYTKSHLYILSGLYGLLRPFDGISYYRLEMNYKFLFNLYDFWQEKITTYLKNNHPNEVFINLCSNEYGKLLKFDSVIQIEFYQIKASSLKIHAMEAKKLRGLMASYLLKNQIQSISKIKNIIIDGYAFNEKLSDQKHFIFTKEIWWKDYLDYY